MKAVLVVLKPFEFKRDFNGFAISFKLLDVCNLPKHGLHIKVRNDFPELPCLQLTKIKDVVYKKFENLSTVLLDLVTLHYTGRTAAGFSRFFI